MKRTLIYIGVIIVVFGSMLLSVILKNSIFIYVLGFLIVLSVLSLPIYLRKFKREYKRQEQMETPEVIDNINESSDSRLSYDVSQVKNVIDIWKHSSKGDIVKGTLFLVLFLGCIVGCITCMSLGKLTLGYIFFGSAFGTILLALIIVKLLEGRAIRPKKGRNYRKATATVLKTTMSSYCSTGTHKKSVGNITYKVFLKMDGKKLTIYSKDYYSDGEKVNVLVDEKKQKIVQIIDRKVDVFDLEDEGF